MSVRWITLDAVEPGWADVLDDAERVRLAGYLRPGDRARFLGAAVLMRALLAQAAGCAPADVSLDRTCSCGLPHGRPVPTGGARGLHVSVSHTGPVVVATVAAAPVGVDVEPVRDALPSPQVVSAVLAPGEPAPAGPAEFADLWTAKEAYLKAVGHGTDLPMDRVRVAGRRASSPGAPDGVLESLPVPVPWPDMRAHLCRLIP